MVLLLNGNQRLRVEEREVGSGPFSALAVISDTRYIEHLLRDTMRKHHLCAENRVVVYTAQHETWRSKIVSFRIMVVSPSYGKQEVEVLKTRRSTAVFLPFVRRRLLQQMKHVGRGPWSFTETSIPISATSMPALNASYLRVISQYSCPSICIQLQSIVCADPIFMTG